MLLLTPGPFRHASLMAARWFVKAYVVPLESSRTTTQISSSGRTDLRISVDDLRRIPAFYVSQEDSGQSGSIELQPGGQPGMIGNGDASGRHRDEQHAAFCAIDLFRRKGCVAGPEIDGIRPGIGRSLLHSRQHRK